MPVFDRGNRGHVVAHLEISRREFPGRSAR